MLGVCDKCMLSAGNRMMDKLNTTHPHGKLCSNKGST